MENSKKREPLIIQIELQEESTIKDVNEFLEKISRQHNVSRNKVAEKIFMQAIHLHKVKNIPIDMKETDGNKRFEAMEIKDKKKSFNSMMISALLLFVLAIIIAIFLITNVIK